MNISHTKTFFCCLILAGLWSKSSEAQDNRATIKTWLNNNKDQVKLLSHQEYQLLSPSVKALLKEDKKVLLYDKQVRLTDIQRYESKRAVPSSIDNLYELEKEKSERESKESKVENEYIGIHAATLRNGADKDALRAEEWLERHAGNVQVIALHDYSKLLPSQRNKNMLVYKGERPNLQDIKAFKAQH